MVKICSQSLILPLKIIFEHSLKKGKFPKIWKKAIVVPVHKKEDKMLVKNYRPISLLPKKKCLKELYIIPFSTIFKVIDFSQLPNLVFFQVIHVLPQLLLIIHEIQTAFDENRTVDLRGVFLDISKAFDKFWHDGIIFTLKAYGVEGELLSLLKKILKIENKELS